VFRLTIVDVQGFGRQKGQSEMYRGHELTVQLLRKVQLQIAVNEDFVEPTVNAILQAGRTGPEGRIGDDKIFILPLEDCVRISTSERGPEAYWPSPPGSYALRGSPARDAERRVSTAPRTTSFVGGARATRSVARGVPTQSVGTR